MDSRFTCNRSVPVRRSSGSRDTEEIEISIGNVTGSSDRAAETKTAPASATAAHPFTRIAEVFNSTSPRLVPPVNARGGEILQCGTQERCPARRRGNSRKNGKGLFARVLGRTRSSPAGDGGRPGGRVGG